MPSFATDAQMTQPPVPQLWAGDSGAFWRQRVDSRPIDQARTAALAQWDMAVGFPGGTRWQGAVYGQPIQIIPANAPRTPVLDDRRPFWDVITGKADVMLPLPPVIRREADPTCPFDKHWRATDGLSLFEAWVLRPKAWPFTGFACSDWAIWDLSRPWNAPGQPRGVVAAAFPHAPLVLTVEDCLSRPLDKALFLGLPDYSNAAPVGPARGTDGTLAAHPLRAGERLLLRSGALDRVRQQAGATSPAANLAMGLATHGLVLGDKTGSVAAVTMTQDQRWPQLLGPGLGLRLTDFVVLVP